MSPVAAVSPRSPAIRQPHFAIAAWTTLLITTASPLALAGDDALSEGLATESYGPNIDLHDPAAFFLSRALAEREEHSAAGVVPGTPGTDVPLEGWNEATQAVNPLNPMNIACGSGFELRVSTDGGATWRDPVPSRIPANFLAQGDPGVAFDASGRLFWSYLASPRGAYISFLGIDAFIAQCDPLTGAILPGYPVNVTQGIGLPGSAGNSHDKEWLAVDNHPGSPFANRLYLLWTNFPPSGGSTVIATHSSDQGLTWTPAVTLQAAGGAFNWPTHIAVAPNGNVFAGFHRQTGFTGNVPNGTSGTITIRRSTDGGASFPQTTLAYAAGQADMTFNVQSLAGNIPGTDFWLQGTVQPWILPDPNVPGRIYVVANDDPDNNVQTGDAADVFIVRSTDSGLTWSAPLRVDHGPGTTFQVMPTAAIDPISGAIVVHYYDNRNSTLNSHGNYLLNVYATVSLDGAQSFMPDFKINDLPFDPDAGARCRFDCGPGVEDVWAGPGVAFAGTDGGHLLRGTPWSILATTGSTIYGVWGTSGTNVYTCGPGGRIHHFDGSQILLETSNTTNALFGIDGRAANDIYAVGANGTIVHYNGGGWSVEQVGPVELHEVWANPQGQVWVAGDLGTVLRYDGTWHALPAPSAEPLGSIWGSSDTDVTVVSWEGAIYRWNGSTWSTQDQSQSIGTSVWGTSATNVLTTGFGRIRRFNGTSWSSENVSEHILFKISGSGPNDIYVVGEEGFIAHYDGIGWTPQTTPVLPLLPTERIGEYNGVAIGGGRTFAVWCGNTQTDAAKPGTVPLDQQAVFDSFDTIWQTGVSIVDASVHVPSVLLEHVTPNPAHEAATVTYALPKPSPVDLAIVDVQGRRVATLLHGNQPAGRHIVSWDGEHPGGGALPAGVYFVRLHAGTETRTERLTLLP